MKQIFSVLLVFALLLTCCPGTYAATAGSIILQEDVADDMTISTDTLLDLNGHTVRGVVTVAKGCTLTVKDSQTDDYTIADEIGYGQLQYVTGNVVAAEGYLQIDEADGISFHKVDLVLTTVTLRTENAGIYYGGKFFGDEVIAKKVDRFGIALRLNIAPDARYMKISSAYSWYEGFTAGAEGNTVSGTVLNNVMKKGLTKAENEARSQYKIYGRAYIRTTDGQYIFGQSQNYSFMKVVQLTDEQWKTMTQTQKNAFNALYNRFKSIMESWHLPNFNAEVNGDIDMPI